MTRSEAIGVIFGYNAMPLKFEKMVRSQQKFTDETQRGLISIWCLALRSGLYPQTTQGILYTETDKGFCCLGVYLSHVDDIPLKFIKGLPMPKDVLEENERDNSIPFGLEWQSIFANLNDRGISFATIADVAEAIFLND